MSTGGASLCSSFAFLWSRSFKGHGRVRVPVCPPPATNGEKVHVSWDHKKAWSRVRIVRHEADRKTWSRVQVVCARVRACACVRACVRYYEGS